MKNRIEFVLHLLFWVFILAAINVNWTANWFDQSIENSTVGPLKVIVFATFFYINTFVLLPKFFSRKTWKKYMSFAFLLFILPELIRIIIFKMTYTNISFEMALFNRAGFLFGMPSPFILALNVSFAYRYIMDRVFEKNQLKRKKGEGEEKSSTPYQDVVLLTDEEVHQLQGQLIYQLQNNEIFLNPKLTLRDLSEAVGSTEKKVSYLLNQNLKTTFYELMNKHRVDKFKDEMSKSENKNLSILGVATNCGFPSKSSFYRAFKSETSMSPSEYSKQISQKA